MNQPIFFISKQLQILPWQPQSLQLPVFISELPVKSLWLQSQDFVVWGVFRVLPLVQISGITPQDPADSPSVGGS